MGFAKQQHIEMWELLAEAEARSFKASYERAQSELRLAMLCRDVAGPKSLEARIVALALARAHQRHSLVVPYKKCTR
jgi:hypothetical protein